MFPSELSTGPFSLLAGQRNPAWSTWVELDDHGDIANYGIQRSWVKPRYRLTYEDADELIDFAPRKKPIWRTCMPCWNGGGSGVCRKELW